MRLVIFGTGRVGASMAPYARSLGAEVFSVTRMMAEKDPARVAAEIARADVVAAAVPDDCIAPWFDVWNASIGGRPAIHFSGAQTIPGIKGYHPLYSFPTSPLPVATMSGVLIAREAGAAAFSHLFPGAANPEIEIRAEDRAFYHALAVLSGNFAAHLWNEVALAFSARFAAPPGIALGPYLAGVVDRFCESPFDSLTGPVARRDTRTIAANLAALEPTPRLKALYEAFIESAAPTADPPPRPTAETT